MNSDPATLDWKSEKVDWAKPVITLSLLHFAVLTGISVVLNVLSRIPPSLINLDAIIHVLHFVYRFILFPKQVFDWLWPGHSFFHGYHLISRIAVHLIWGGFLVGVIRFWRRSHDGDARR